MKIDKRYEAIKIAIQIFGEDNIEELFSNQRPDFIGFSETIFRNIK